MTFDTSAWTSISTSFLTVAFNPFKQQHANFSYIFNNIELTHYNFHTAICPQAVALLYRHETMPDPSSPKYPGFDYMRKSIYVFRYNGQLVKQFQIYKPETVLGMHFLQSTAYLAVLYSDGELYVYTATGVKVYFNRLNMNPGCYVTVSAHYFDRDGLAVLYNDNSVVFIQNLASAVTSRKFRQKQLSYAYFGKIFNQTKYIEFYTLAFDSQGYNVFLTGVEDSNTVIVLISCKTPQDARKYRITELPGEASVRPEQQGFYQVRMHYNGAILLYATFYPQPLLTVIDAQQHLDDRVSSPRVYIVHEVTAFGDFIFDFFDVLPVYFNQISQVVSAVVPKKAGTREVDLYYGAVLGLQADIDGVNVAGADSNGNARICEVPGLLQKVFNPAQPSDCYKLFAAYSAYIQAYQDKTAITRSDCLLKYAAANIIPAIHDLIGAANACYDVVAATEILKAAAFAKLYAPPYFYSEITRQFDEAKRKLRVRASLAQSAGMSLTGRMQEDSSLGDICYQLGSFGDFDFALKLAKYANLSNDDFIKPVLVLRAYTKVLDPANASRKDEDLFREIENELAKWNSGGVFRTCAEMLTKENYRSYLVSQLIEKEPSLVDYVHLFLELRQYYKAIRKAYEAFSEDLIIESFMKAINDMENDQHLYFTQIFAPENEADKFPQYIRNLLVFTVFNNASSIAKYPSLEQFGNYFLDKKDSLLQIGDDIKDYQFYYVVNLRSYCDDAPEVFSAHSMYLEKLYAQTEPKSETRYNIDLQMYAQYFCCNSKTASSFYNQRDVSLAGLCRTYGREAMRQSLQYANKSYYASIYASSSPILDDFKKFAASIQKKCDASDELVYSQAIIGLIDGVEEFGKSAGDMNWAQYSGATLIEDYYKTLSARQYQKIANLVATSIASKLPEMIRNERLFANALIAALDKKELIKVALIVDAPALLTKALDGAGQVEMTLVHQSWKSMSKALQDAARTAVAK